MPIPGRFTPGKVTSFPLYRRLGGPQGRSGRMRIISPPTGIRSPDRPAHSESLWRLASKEEKFVKQPIAINMSRKAKTL